MVDLVGSDHYAILDGEGNGTFEVSKSDLQFGCFLRDLDNDGIPEIIPYSGAGIYRFDLTTLKMDKEPLYSLPRAENKIDYSMHRVYDFNGDGLLDLLVIRRNLMIGEMSFQYYVNQGDFKFELIQEFTPLDYSPYLSLKDFYDFDNDGLYDFLVEAYYSEHKYYIQWGDGSRTDFDEFSNMGSDGYDRFGNTNNFNSVVFDFDNNGYLDIFFRGRRYTDGVYKCFIAYFFPQKRIEFVEVSGDTYSFASQDDNHYLNTSPILKFSDKEYSLAGCYNILVTPNEKPSAPKNLRALQNKDGLVIQWDHSVDKETPATNMRYNVSVKHKGAEGDGAYLISPLNMESNTAALPFGYNISYLKGNTMFIPKSSIPAGEYEIRVQGIDMWSEVSEFTEICYVSVKDSCPVNMPTSTFEGCETKIIVDLDYDVDIDWDGAQVSNNDKTYYAIWNEVGEKNIKINGIKYPILVKPMPDLNFTLPNKVSVNAKVKVDGENIAQTKWSSTSYKVDILRNIDGTMEFCFKAEGEYQIDSECEIDGYVFNNTYIVNVTPEIHPEISNVSVDNTSGKTVVFINKDNTPKDAIGINLYKESAKNGEYVLLDKLSLDTDRYVDLSSNPDFNVSSYKVSYILNYGESACSTSHRSILCSINHTDGSGWNLMWTKYEGLNVAKYRVLRGTSPDDLKVIDEVEGYLSSYLDKNAPQEVELFYAVDVVALESSNYRRSPKLANEKNTNSWSNIVSTANASYASLVQTLIISSADDNNILDGSKASYMQLTALIYPVTATIRTINWTILEGKEHATVDRNGIVRPVAEGKATIRAYTVDGSGLYADYDIEVINVPIAAEALVLSATDVKLYVDWDYPITAQTFPENSTYQEINWSSSNINVAYYVIGNGIWATGVGEAIITATLVGTNLSAQCHVEVREGSQYELGDANRNGDVSITDVVTTIDYILGLNPKPFDISAADVSVDFEITMADVVGIVNLVLGRDVDPFEAIQNKNIELSMTASGMFKSNTQFVASLSLDNSIPVCAMQFDMVVPDGISFDNNIELSDRSDDSYNVVYRQISDDTYRVILYSYRNAPINEGFGDILYLDFNNNALDEESKILFKNIKVIKADMTQHCLDECTIGTPEVTSVDSMWNDNIKIYTKGMTLYIDSDVNTSLQFVNISGTMTLLDVKAGHNEYGVNVPGIYFVNGKKIVLK